MMIMIMGWDNAKKKEIARETKKERILYLGGLAKKYF